MLDTAIIGMGRWGQTLVESVQGRNDAGLRFVAGCTGTPAKARDWAERQGIRLLPSFEAVLQDTEVKAVALAWVEFTLSPTPLTALTTKKYVVPLVSPVLVNDVPVVVPTVAYGPPVVVARLTL